MQCTAAFIAACVAVVFGAVDGIIVKPYTTPVNLTTADILDETQWSQAPSGKMQAIVRHFGDPGTAELRDEIKTSITWDVGAITGCRPSGWQSGSGQRGCYNRPGANAFQAGGTEFSSFVNSSSWAHTVPVRGGGPQAQVFTQWGKVGADDRRPWAKDDGTTDYTTRFALEVYLKMPMIQGELAAPNRSGAVGQTGIEFYLGDTISGKPFPIGGAIWDSRPFGDGCGSEFVASDTFTPFVSSPIMPGTRYITAAPESAHYANGAQAWREYRLFKYTVNASQLELAVRDINARFPGTNLSTSASNYVVNSVLYGNEITGYFNHSITYAVTVANLSAYVERDSSYK